jgi:hypothetical protein
VSSKSGGGALLWIVIAVVAVAAYKPAAEAVTPGPTGGSQHDIPADYLALYQSVPKCKGLDWQTLAAVGWIETNHGRSKLPGVRSGQNYAGARGPMQFLQPTYDGVRKRHPEIGPNIYDPRNAIPAAARKLCDDGADQSVRRAIFSYNHSDEYVDDVLAKAKEYRS